MAHRSHIPSSALATARTKASALSSCLALLAAVGISACSASQMEPHTATDANGPAEAASAESTSSDGPLEARAVAVMPRGLTTMGATVMGNAVYTLGGYFGQPHSYSRRYQSEAFNRLDLATGQWESLKGVEPVQSAALVNDGRYVYQLGGMRALNAPDEDENMQSSDDFMRFDPEKNEWQKLSPMPQRRSSHQAVLVDGTLYVVGGWTLSGETPDHEWRSEMLTCQLSAMGESGACDWQSSKMPFNTRAMGAAAFQGRLYVLGGLTPEGGSDAVKIYDPKTQQWSDGPSLPKGNLTIRAAEYDGALYANGADGKLYRLAEDGSAWNQVAELRLPRMFHQIVATEQGVMAVGGIPSRHRGDRVREVELVSTAPAPAGVVYRSDFPGRARNRQAVFPLGQQLYVFGGNDSLGQHDFKPNNFVDQGYRFDLGSIEWKDVKALPVARQSMATFVVNADSKEPLGYAIGGFGWANDKLSTQGEVYRYHFAKQEWTKMPAGMAEARSQFGLAQVDGDLLLFGGLNYDEERPKEDRFRHPLPVLKLSLDAPEQGFEEAGFALSSPRRAFAGAQLGDEYFMTGGLEADFQSVETCVAVHLKTHAERSIACPSAHRLGGDLVALGDHLFLVGGSAKGPNDEKREPTRAIEAYDVKANSWQTVDLKVPLDDPGQLRAFAHNGQLLVYSAQSEQGHATVALLEPSALLAGNSKLASFDLVSSPEGAVATTVASSPSK